MALSREDRLQVAWETALEDQASLCQAGDDLDWLEDLDQEDWKQILRMLYNEPDAEKVSAFLRDKFEAVIYEHSRIVVEYQGTWADSVEP